MYVGTLRVRLRIREARSLKDKRQVVRSLMDRLRNHFGAAIAEVDERDNWQLAVIGFALVGADSTAVRQAMESMANACRSHPVAEFIDCRLDVQSFPD